ncbi:KR domain-containing protein [Sphingobacteriales bacterium UPWRP_1]|nr:hypothetical protein BVG80_05930 [Sphingobacteriales bacterium TSM_CSM]PSJ74478.1 KR domain-containing protein [Sphingobacteriales bacterium UPWRP_1]
MMKAVIIGATSGIGEELAKELARRGYTIGITGRRTQLLQQLQNQLQPSAKVVIQTMDITRFDEARAGFLRLIEELGGLDLVVINAGIGSYANAWETEFNTIQTNVTGFTAIANAAFHYFTQQKKGHIVGISSLAAERGGSRSPVYNASKAFISNYMEGLRHVSARKQLPIAITDIRPGFVKTPMTEKNKGMFWIVPAPKAARQIADAIEQQRKIAYISKRWRLVSWLLRILPDALYQKMS